MPAKGKKPNSRLVVPSGEGVNKVYKYVGSMWSHIAKDGSPFDVVIMNEPVAKGERLLIFPNKTADE